MTKTEKIKKTKIDLAMTQQQKEEFLKVGSGAVAGMGVGALGAALTLGIVSFPTEADAASECPAHLLEEDVMYDAAGPELAALSEEDLPISENSVEADSSAENSVLFDVSIYSDAPLASQVNDSMTFDVAYATARAEVGAGGIFTWKGNIFNTYTAEEWKAMNPTQQEDYFASMDSPALEVENLDSGYINVSPSTMTVSNAPSGAEYPAHWGTGGGTVYHAAMGASVEEVERFIPTDGDIHVVSLDVNRDGVIDGIATDVNHDGRIDVVTYDPNEISEFPSEVAAVSPGAEEIVFDGADSYSDTITSVEIEVENPIEIDFSDTDGSSYETDITNVDDLDLLEGL